MEYMLPFRQLCVLWMMADCHHMPIRLVMSQWNICFSTANHTAITGKGGGMLQLNSYVKYHASSSYHLTRLVFMKTFSPCTFTAVLTRATAKRCSFATGGTFSNSRASLQFTATLANNTTRERCEKRRSSLKWVVQVQPDLTDICHAHE